MQGFNILYPESCAAVFFVGTGTLFAGDKSAKDVELERIQSFIGVMQSYLDAAEQWVKMVSDKDTAVYLVAERVTEIYEAQGHKDQAIPDLRKILSKYENNRAVRNAIHFKIAEIYKEAGQHEKALEELDALLDAEEK